MRFGAKANVRVKVIVPQNVKELLLTVRSKVKEYRAYIKEKSNMTISLVDFASDADSGRAFS